MKEDVETAARNCCEKVIAESKDNFKNRNDIVTPTMIMMYGTPFFKYGAEWRINSVFHDANEKPELGQMIVLYDRDGKYAVCTYMLGMEINSKLRWAYIKDLIPNTKD
jgi:hypothetical protein